MSGKHKKQKQSKRHKNPVRISAADGVTRYVYQKIGPVVVLKAGQHSSSR